MLQYLIVQLNTWNCKWKINLNFHFYSTVFVFAKMEKVLLTLKSEPIVHLPPNIFYVYSFLFVELTRDGWWKLQVGVPCLQNKKNNVFFLINNPFIDLLYTYNQKISFENKFILLFLAWQQFLITFSLTFGMYDIGGGAR